MRKTDHIVIGSLVAFNTLPDAVWFKVLAIRGFDLSVTEAGTAYAPQQIDKSAVKQVRPPAP